MALTLLMGTSTCSLYSSAIGSTRRLRQVMRLEESRFSSDLSMEVRVRITTICKCGIGLRPVVFQTLTAGST